MKGILFKPDVWKAKLRVLEQYGEAQTRRVIKPQPSHFHYTSDAQYPCKPDGEQIQPRYQVGETVCIKEALFHHLYLGEAGYLFDQTPVFVNQTIGDMLKWRWQKDILPGMFMPQEAARYFIEITGVEAQRLQEITENDAIAEGVDTDSVAPPIMCFSVLWGTINKPPYDWQGNPYVFKYTFKLVNGNGYVNGNIKLVRIKPEKIIVYLRGGATLTYQNIENLNSSGRVGGENAVDLDYSALE